MLLRLAVGDEVERIDWDEMQFRLDDSDSYHNSHSLVMPDPLGFTKADGAGNLKAEWVEAGPAAKSG